MNKAEIEAVFVTYGYCAIEGDDNIEVTSKGGYITYWNSIPDNLIYITGPGDTYGYELKLKSIEHLHEIFKVLGVERIKG